jgi:hypothetical protein
VINEKVFAPLINCGFIMQESAISEMSIFDPGKPFECNTHLHPVALIILEIEINWSSSMVQQEQLRNSLHFEQHDDSRFSGL